MGTKREALERLYGALNHPVKAGRVWVQYDRKAIDAAIDVLKQIMVMEGYEFRPRNDGEAMQTLDIREIRGSDGVRRRVPMALAGVKS